jgi:hypothetical protein
VRDMAMAGNHAASATRTVVPSATPTLAVARLHTTALVLIVVVAVATISAGLAAIAWGCHSVQDVLLGWSSWAATWTAPDHHAE